MIGRYVSRELLQDIRRAKRTTPRRRDRRAVRRGDCNRCPLCRQQFSVREKTWNFHHVYPRNPPPGWPYLPGWDDMRNVVRTHPRCNRKAGNRITEEGLVTFREITGYWPYCVWPQP